MTSPPYIIPPLSRELLVPNTEETEEETKDMILPNVVNRTRRENRRGENLRCRHSRVAIAIHISRREKGRERGEGEEKKEDVMPIKRLREGPDPVDPVDGSARGQITV